ncbi:vWA domain-containing protein [Kitasatospora saccharophila]|uniref:vWA domain-containing protein n=1 Tax=Kitasatospora saccharophila TaxID=407973 RepID=UPI00362E45A3
MRRATVTASALAALAVLGAVGAAPAAVPGPGAGEAVVTVRTGGDRTGAQSVGPLAGVRLGLFAAEGDAAPVDPGWGVCVSDADGDCSFRVPDTGPGGANAGRELTVRQPDGGVPAGWFANPALRTGPGSGSDSVASPYVFRTPALAAGNTYRSTADFMISDDYRNLPTASGGVWQDSRNNPPLPAHCGLDVALVLDLSASVGSELPFLKAAADHFTDALTGTPSRLAVFSFDQASPATGVSANHPELHPVSTPAGAAEFKSLYADWTLGKGTNWDTALWSVARAAPVYDAVVVLTDGNPTRFADDAQGDGSRTHFRDVENGVFSANAVKAKGSRLIALGVGKGVEGVSGLNLRALSGPTAYADGGDLTAADYFQTKDFATAGQQLHDLALSHCDNSVTVVKQLVPAGTTGEDTTGAVNAPAGWTFGASTGTPGVGGLPRELTTTDDGTGSVVFQPELGERPSASLDISEVQHDGYELVTKDGKNAVCVNLDTGQPVDVSDTGTADRPGFALELPRLAAVELHGLQPARRRPGRGGPDGGQDLADRRHRPPGGRPARRVHRHRLADRAGRRRGRAAAVGHRAHRLPDRRPGHRHRTGRTRRPRLHVDRPADHRAERRPGRPPARQRAHPRHRAHPGRGHQHRRVPPHRPVRVALAVPRPPGRRTPRRHRQRGRLRAAPGRRRRRPRGPRPAGPAGPARPAARRRLTDRSEPVGCQCRTEG